MARGGHHGGGFHSGGHHGGGFHGGGFGGGFYGGGSFHGGGSYHDGDDDNFGLLAYIIRGVFIGGFFLFYYCTEIAEGNVPYVNLLMVGIYIAAVVFFVLGLKESKRTADLYQLKRATGNNSLQVYKADFTEYSSNSVSDKVSWAGKYDTKYRIAFYDRDFGEDNIDKVREMMDRTPKIVWMRPVVWLVLGIISAVSNFFFYELVIPVFENMIMTDEAFAFIDEVVFYFPAVFTLLCAILCFAMMKVKDSLLHKCALRIVQDNNAAYEKMKTQNFIAKTLSNKWYYNNCPNCGVDAKKDMRICTHCGTSLEVKDIATEPLSSVHRISSEAENNGKVKKFER